MGEAAGGKKDQARQFSRHRAGLAVGPCRRRNSPAHVMGREVQTAGSYVMPALRATEDEPELETEPNRAVGRRRRASAIAGVSITASSQYLRVSIHSGTVTRSSAPPPLLATRAASPARGLPPRAARLRPTQRGPAARALSVRGLPSARRAHALLRRRPFSRPAPHLPLAASLPRAARLRPAHRGPSPARARLPCLRVRAPFCVFPILQFSSQYRNLMESFCLLCLHGFWCFMF